MRLLPSMPMKSAIIFSLALLLTAAVACAGEQTDGGQATPYPTYTLYPTYTPVAAVGSQPGMPTAAPTGAVGQPTSPVSGAVTSGQPTPQPTDDPSLRDISPEQHRQLDQQIADLSDSPQILVECAAEAGDPVPAPGSEGEAQWYGQAAIKYSACAASKATGVDLTGGN